jgi:glycosyltransferase involved in cell wall biosynthesis
VTNVDADAVVLDAAGGSAGGAGRWRAELVGYLSATEDPVRVIGLGRRLTPRWLAQREYLARGAAVTVAANNACFARAGTQKRVLSINALHYLHSSEEHLLRGFSRFWCTQIPVVRRLVAHADLVVVPSSAMAERVAFHIPQAARRLVVRPHPVTSVGPRRPASTPFILVPVVPGPYKNLFPQLRSLIGIMEELRHPARIRVTARLSDLPEDLASHRRIAAVGILQHSDLAELWRTAWAAFFPSAVEAFGWPLAEARVYGVPVIALNTEQSREIAGAALCGYDPADPSSLMDALAAAHDPVVAEPNVFDRDAYFRWFLGGASRNCRPICVGR